MNPAIVWGYGNLAGDLHALISIPGVSTLRSLCGLITPSVDPETPRDRAAQYLRPCATCRAKLLEAFGLPG